jgi:hypothetical protein
MSDPFLQGLRRRANLGDKPKLNSFAQRRLDAKNEADVDIHRSDNGSAISDSLQRIQGLEQEPDMDEVQALIAKHKAEKAAKNVDKKEKKHKKDKKHKKHKQKHEPNQTCGSCGEEYVTSSRKPLCKDCRRKEALMQVDTKEFGDWARIESI